MGKATSLVLILFGIGATYSQTTRPAGGPTGSRIPVPANVISNPSIAQSPVQNKIVVSVDGKPTLALPAQQSPETVAQQGGGRAGAVVSAIGPLAGLSVVIPPTTPFPQVTGNRDLLPGVQVGAVGLTGGTSGQTGAGAAGSAGSSAGSAGSAAAAPAAAATTARPPPTTTFPGYVVDKPYPFVLPPPDIPYFGSKWVGPWGYPIGHYQAFRGTGQSITHYDYYPLTYFGSLMAPFSYGMSGKK